MTRKVPTAHRADTPKTDKAVKLFKMPQPLDVVMKTLIEKGLEQEAKTLLIVSKADPLKYFCPNGRQEEYIRAIGNSETKIPVILLTAANGIGKTTISVHAICNFIYGPKNGWFDYPIFRNFPFPKTIWYISTAEALKNTIVPEFEKLLKPGTYQTYKDGKAHWSRLECDGWNIVFKTFDQDIQTFESANCGIIVVDEPAPEAVWKAIKSRRRMGCITMLPLTPLFCPPYLIDEVKRAADDGRKGFSHITADVYTACRRRGVRGHLDPEIIDKMVADYDVEERKARAYGEFAYFSGKIYQDLSENLHRVNPADYPIPKGSLIKHIVDPHDSRPCAAIWMAVTPIGRKIIFAESPIDKSKQYWEIKSGLTIEQEIRQWINVEEDFYQLFRQNQHIRILDHIFGWQTRMKRTFAEEFYDEGKRQGKEFHFLPSYSANDEVHFGHVQVRKSLQPLHDGKPGLVIWDTCYHTWQGLSHYVRKHETTKSAEDKPAAETKIIEKYKDFADCVRFGVCDETEPDTWQPTRTLYERRLEEVINDENTDNQWSC